MHESQTDHATMPILLLMRKDDSADGYPMLYCINIERVTNSGTEGFCWLTRYSRVIVSDKCLDEFTPNCMSTNILPVTNTKRWMHIAHTCWDSIKSWVRDRHLESYRGCWPRLLLYGAHIGIINHHCIKHQTLSGWVGLGVIQYV